MDSKGDANILRVIDKHGAVILEIPGETDLRFAMRLMSESFRSEWALSAPGLALTHGEDLLPPDVVAQCRELTRRL